MRFSVYLRFRWRCFGSATRQLMQQLQQLMLWLVILLGPALAALLFMLLLALGVLYRPDLPVQQRLLLCWCLICGQTLLLWLYQDAVLASRYQIFLRSFAVPSVWQRSADMLLMLLCSPMLLLHLLIIASADLNLWHTVLPQLSFAILQLLFTVSALYRPQPTALLLLLCLPAMLLWPLSFSSGLGLLALLWLSALLPFRFPSLQFRSRNALLFWLKCWRHQLPQWLSRCMLLLLCLLMAYISLQQRPDLSALISFICGLCLLVLSTSMQLNSNNTVQHYALFFNLYPQALQRWQYLPPLLLSMLSLSLLYIIWPEPGLILVLLPTFAISWYLACHQPKHFISGWLTGASCSTCLFILVGFG
ncbi:DUF6136 family protein [Rheinheimera baltica]|uniref:DUF6136 family protein n=1 Tax=Rheinheimera baltica TaxID=67576 RepID=UPI000428D449|nr:DUF6136 family protein [Rheinheimera baltica]